MSHPPPQARAVVLAHGPDAFPGVVGSLLREGLDPAGVLVVQNPRHPAEPHFESGHPGVAVLRMPSNGGYAQAMNAGLDWARRSGSEWALLLTHDVTITPGAVEALIRAARRAEGYAVLGPQLQWRRADGHVYRTTFGGWCDRTGDVGQRRVPGPSTEIAGVSACDFVDGAVMLVRLAAADRLGPLEERFFLYFEETDFCLRARRQGLGVGCALDAVFIQESGKDRRPGAYAYLYTRNAVELGRRRAGRLGMMVQMWRRVSSLPLRRLVRRSTAAQERRDAAAAIIGSLVGLGALALGRWGPPPSWLPGLGDMAGERAEPSS